MEYTRVLIQFRQAVLQHRKLSRNTTSLILPMTDRMHRAAILSLLQSCRILSLTHGTSSRLVGEAKRLYHCS